MRVVVAALFVVGGTVIGVSVRQGMGLLDRGGVFILIPEALFLGLAVIALWLFNAKGSHGSKSGEEYLRELEAAGLVRDESFKATRAFGVAEFEDEGQHYFLQLEDGRVLFLSGQYLYEYEHDPKLDQPRKFPCSQFTIRRHATERFVVEIVCVGEVLQPESEVQCFSAADLRENLVPADGDIITDETFDAIRARLETDR